MGFNMSQLQHLGVRKYFSKISMKIIGRVGAAVLIILVLSLAAVDRGSYSLQLEQLLSTQKIITQSQAQTLSEQFSEGVRSGAVHTLTGVLTNPSIEGVKVDYADGSDSLLVGEINSEFDLSLPVYFTDKTTGSKSVAASITTYASTQAIDAARWLRFKYAVAMVLIVMLSIVAVLALAVYTIIGLPLHKVTQAIDTVEQGEFPQVDWNSNDEMGLVIKRLNYLHSIQHERLSGLEQALNEKERHEADRLRNLVNASFEGILIYQQNELVDLNEPMAGLLGGTRETLIEKELAQLFSWDVLAFLQAAHNDNARPFLETSIASVVDSNAEPVSVEMYINTIEYAGNDAKVVVVRDITERLKAEERMRQLALYDGLTNLPNRMFFMECLAQALARADRLGSSMAVMYLDLDHFKDVNDTHGHAAGDELLQNVAKVIGENIRETDTGARLGGDEFAIILEGDNSGSFAPEVLAMRLLEGVNRCKMNAKIGSDFGASIGIGIHPGHPIKSSDLLMHADLALYHAKDNGRNNYQVYTDNLDNDYRRHRLLVERLRHALENNLLELHFQPQANSSSESIVGFEALLRWSDVMLGWIPPQEIVAAAEKEGLIRELGAWVIRQACTEAAKWQYPYRIAVNLSPIELAYAGLPDYISSVLDETELDPARLELEITELALMADMDQVGATLQRLKNIGVTIAMDDFGSGYSSLSVLKKFPFDRVKIDRSFVSNGNEDSEENVIAAAVIDIGRRLNVDVVAEGIENQEQLQRMKDQDCAEIQGFFIGKPIPQDEMLTFLDNISSEIKKRAS